MKKFLLALSLLLTLLIPAKRAFADYDVSSTKRDKGVWVRGIINGPVGISTNVILVDLSDTVNWPHKDPTGEIRIDNINLEFDKPAASSGTIKIGVVTSVLGLSSSTIVPSSGTITWFFGRSLSSATTNADMLDPFNLENGAIRCRVNPDPRAGFGYAGKTPYILSNDTENFINTSQMLTLAGSTIPAIGDIVVQVNNSSTVDGLRAIVGMLYHSIPR